MRRNKYDGNLVFYNNRVQISGLKRPYCSRIDCVIVRLMEADCCCACISL